MCYCKISFRSLDIFQIDLVHMSELASSNDDIKFLLCCIDCFSKRLFVVPLERSRAEDAVKGLEIIFECLASFPRSIICDRYVS